TTLFRTLSIIFPYPFASTQALPTLPLPSLDLSPAIRALLYVHRFVCNQAQSTRAPLHLLVLARAWARGSRLPLPKPQPHPVCLLIRGQFARPSFCRDR